MSVLFTPLRIGTMEIRNRFVASAVAEGMVTEENRLSDRYLRRHDTLARNGVGLIIPGNHFVNREGWGAPRTLRVDNDHTIADLRRLTDTVHRHGAMIAAQLAHAGRQCDTRVTGGAPLAPSAVRDAVTWKRPRAMTHEQIVATIHDFGNAARRVRDAGFDAVQIHAGHGYLVGAFLSGRTNRRRDQWGGTAMRRMQFVLSVYDAVRRAVGVEFPVLVKLNGRDRVRNGVTLAESVMLGMELERRGLDAIEVSGGTEESPFTTMMGDIPHDLVRPTLPPLQRALYPIGAGRIERAAAFVEGFNVEEAAEIKRHVSIPVIAVGGLRRSTTMIEGIQQGRFDAVALGRPLVRQPNVVRLFEADALSEPITCVNCNRCTAEVILHDRPLQCYLRDRQTPAGGAGNRHSTARPVKTGVVHRET